MIKLASGLSFSVIPGTSFTTTFFFQLSIAIIALFFCIQSFIIYKKKGYPFHRMYSWGFALLIVSSVIYIVIIKSSWHPRSIQNLVAGSIMTLCCIIAACFLFRAMRLQWLSRRSQHRR